MEGSVLSFLKAEWKASDTGSAHWASSYYYTDKWTSNGKYNRTLSELHVN